MTDNGLKLDEPEPFGHYLGVGQSPIKMNQDELNKRLANIRPLFAAPDAKDAAEDDDDTDADDLGGAAAGTAFATPSSPDSSSSPSGIRAIRYDMSSFFNRQPRNIVS